MLLLILIIGIIVTLVALLFFIFAFNETTESAKDHPFTRILMSAKKSDNKYMLAIETCAGKNTLEQPVIQITSDIDEKTIKISKDIMIKKCFTTGTTIKASNIDSISFSTISTEKFSNPVLKEAEHKKLLHELQVKNQELSKLIQNPTTSDFDTKLTKIINDISELRKDLNRVKSQ